MKSGKIVLMMLKVFLTGVCFGAGQGSSAQSAKQEESAEVKELRAGKNFIKTKVYTAQEDEEILKVFEGLRVADVADGMDKVGLTNVGLMSPEIHALWKDTVHYTHRFIGIAVTIRYVPRAKAKEVAEFAHEVIEADKAGRRGLYEKLGLEPDDSVK